jgi:hypothetical protein
MLALTKPTTAIAMAFPATNARFFPLAIVIPLENDAQGDVNPTANRTGLYRKPASNKELE